MRVPRIFSVVASLVAVAAGCSFLWVVPLYLGWPKAIFWVGVVATTIYAVAVAIHSSREWDEWRQHSPKGMDGLVQVGYYAMTVLWPALVFGAMWLIKKVYVWASAFFDG